MQSRSTSALSALAVTTSLGGPALAQHQGGEQVPSVRTKLTTTAGSEGDYAQLAELTFKSSALSGKTAFESLASERLFGENLNWGLNLNFGLLPSSQPLNNTLNVGLGLRDGEVDLGRASFKHSFSARTYLAATYAETPTDAQAIAEGGIGLNDTLSLQGAIDDVGNMRARFLVQEQEWGFSIAAGKQNDKAVFNASMNTDRIWVTVGGGEEQPLQLRGVWGNIPANRSDFAGSFSRPGVNDISIFQDQTVRTFIGANPAFGLMPAQAPDAFLGKNPGDLVLDTQYVEDRVLTGRLVGRLGDIGFLDQTWVSAGLGRHLDSESNFFSLETGTHIGPGELRLRAEVEEDGRSKVGLLFSFEW